MYKPLEFCRAYEWAAGQVMANSLAMLCGVDALFEEMPDAARDDWDDDQMAVFRFLYDNPAMREVLSGESSDGEPMVNRGWWPTYAQVKLLPGFPVITESNPWG